MIAENRANLFEDALDDFDPTEFGSNKPKKPLTHPEKKAAKAIAEKSGFKSREPKSVSLNGSEKSTRQQRRRRTGRDTQFNMKCKSETIDAYVAIADLNDWGLGETLEHAVKLLEKEYGTKK